MKLITKYSAVTTRDMSNIEIAGIQFFFNKWLEEIGEEPSELYYCSGHLNTQENVYYNPNDNEQPETVERIGLVNDNSMIMETRCHETNYYKYYWLNLHGEIKEIELLNIWENVDRSAIA
jgi:hypothetical protein